MIDRRNFLIGLGGAAVVAPRAFGQAPSTPVANPASLAPPSNGSYMMAIIQDQQLDRQFGLEFKPTLYSDTGALYADFASGKSNSLYAALYNGVNFRSRGVPIQLMFTIATSNHAIVSKNPSIREAEDLKGKTIAATTSSGQWGLVVLFLKSHGLDPRRNVNVVNGAPAAVQTQLAAEKVDAGVLWDPALSNMLTAGFHVVGDMNGVLRKTLGMAADAPVWYLGGYGWQPWLEQDAEGNRRILAMFQAAAEFYYREPEKADRIVSAFTHIPLEALKFSRDHDFAQFRVLPAIHERATLDKSFEGFKDAGFLTAVPGDALYYPWPGLKT
jgi:ABC-type nitrate/sulfonate/bicarbonate transport system substrate-binding protein